MRKTLVILAFLPVLAQAQVLETIKVVGTRITQTKSDLSQEFSLIETVMPESINSAGGYGGFAGFTERGVQTSHTQVFRNGVPMNDAGSGWYDFGHDINTGNERVTLVNGPNSVLYGSGSLGGTVFINDNIGDNTYLRLGDRHSFTALNIANKFSISYFDVNNRSVRSDNTEADRYQNTSLATMFDVGNLKVNANYTNYNYDYDQCWTVDWGLPTNDCKQIGERGNLSMRDDNITLGYNFNNINFYSKDKVSYTTKSERIYSDYRNTYDHGFAKTVYGVTVEEEKFNTDSKTRGSVYVSTNTSDQMVGFGLRYNGDNMVGRFGLNVNDYTMQVGTSYRNPSLYELNGDGYVNKNDNLLPEQAFGIELGYKYLTVFRYNFNEGIDYNFNNNQFVNTGKYNTQGVRFQEAFNLFYGTVRLNMGYTDSDQIRVPKYRAIITTDHVVNNLNFRLKYTVAHDRGYDFNGEKIDNVNQFDMIIENRLSTNLTVSVVVQDLFDNRYEHIPGYGAGGRQVFLTVNFR